MLSQLDIIVKRYTEDFSRSGQAAQAGGQVDRILRHLGPFSRVHLGREWGGWVGVADSFLRPEMGVPLETAKN